MQDKLIGIKEAAELLGVSDKTLRNWDNDGRLVAVKTKGGHRKYRLGDIQKIQRGDMVMNIYTNKEKNGIFLYKECEDGIYRAHSEIWDSFNEWLKSNNCSVDKRHDLYVGWISNDECCCISFDCGKTWKTDSPDKVYDIIWEKCKK